MKEYIAEYIVPVEKKGNDYMFDFVNAKPLIRCKDCKWYEFDVSHRCGYTGLNGYIAEDDFCSKAEPKVKK